MNDNGRDNAFENLKIQAARAGCTVDELIEQATRYHEAQREAHRMRPSLRVQINGSQYLYHKKGRVVSWVQSYINEERHLAHINAIKETVEMAIA